MSDDFNWDGVTDKVVVPHQPEIAVYANSDGGIVLRQAGWPDEDHWVHFHPAHAVAIIHAILEHAEVPMHLVEITDSGFGDTIQPRRTEIDDAAPSKSKKDRTNAERQKRYRDRKKQARDASRNGDPVTKRNGKGVTPLLIAAE